MNQLNSLIIEGNVVNEMVEVVEPVAGFKVAKLSIGVNCFFKNAEGEKVNEVSYFDIECYGQMAQIVSDKCVKGRGIRVVGRLKQDRWTDNENKTHSKVYVVAEHIEFKPMPKVAEVKE